MALHPSRIREERIVRLAIVMDFKDAPKFLDRRYYYSIDQRKHDQLLHIMVSAHRNLGEKSVEIYI